MKIKVALAEDNAFLADSLKEKLSLFDDIDFKFHATNGYDLLQKLPEFPIDLVLMDIEMPIMNGLEATAQVHAQFPNIKIVILTVFDDEDKIFDAIQSGAMGYLLKDEPPQKIHEGIKIVMNEGASMSPIIAAKSLAILRNSDSVKVKEPPTDFALTAREIDVLEHLSTGLNYNEIATLLFISPVTVRKHIENIYRKLQVNNKVQAIQKAARHRIIK